MFMNSREAAKWVVKNFGRGSYFDDTDIVRGDEDGGTYASIWPGAEPNTVIVRLWNTEPPVDQVYPAWKGFGPEPHERPGFPNSYRIPLEKLDFIQAFRERLEIPETVDDQRLWDTMASYGIRGGEYDEGEWAETEIKAELTA
jgi:hypothetical protein